MPRRSYEAYKLDKLSHRRRPSFVESETDAESLASFSTFQSGSSYFSHTSSAPSPRLSSFSTSLHAAAQPLASPSNNRHRALSPASVASPAPSTSSHRLGLPDAKAEREKRRKRREERKQKSTLAGDQYDSPLRRWLRWMSRHGQSHWTLPIGLACAAMIKVAVGYGGFSGQDSPPMYGDFEAQRHWMEITIHTPKSEWYYFAPEWWLLDYPPLTAYASWLCGKLGSSLSPEHFALNTSWGLSPPALVTFMRLSVLGLEMAVWWSAVYAWVTRQGAATNRSWRSQMTGILTVLLQPSLILVDNGHFQYNSVLLGLSLWSLHFLNQGQDLLACIAFSLALCFKQMGLYYAPAIGCYLLGKCLWLGGFDGAIHLVKLGIVTVSTFVLIFLPWLQPFPDSLLQVLHRVFPFARGIFEDKVANFWCASNVVLKWRNWFSIAGMARLASVATLATLMPLVLVLLYAASSVRSTTSTQKDAAKPQITLGSVQSAVPSTIKLLPIALFNSAMTFFLFSFQVHEKSILLPLMPLTLLMTLRGGKDGDKEDDELWTIGALVNNVAVFSMWPLLKRDGQELQYGLSALMWNWMIGYTPASVKSGNIRYLTYVVYAVIFAIHVPDILPDVVRAPQRYPDLFVVLNVLLSFGVFSLAWLWSGVKLLQGCWAIQGLAV